MSLSKLIDFIGKDNIVDQIDEKILDDLSERVKRQFEEDRDSMAEWMESVRESRELMKQEFHGRSTPWEGASNFKTPLLTESAVAFGDKSSLELLRAPSLVKSEIIGKDPERKKKEIAERITEGMNYQINHRMGWRTEQKRLLYILPNDGTLFKTVFFDPLEQRERSEIIAYPDFVVNQATKSMDECRSFTQILDFSRNEAEEKFRSELWHGDIGDIYPKESDGDEGSNEAEGTVDASENTDHYLQQQCWADLDDDDYEEPYTVTFHEQTNTIVRIVARYDEQSLIVRSKNGAVADLVKSVQGQLDSMIADQGGVEAMQLIGLPLPEQPDLSEFKLVKIEPLVNIVKYGFIPSPDGTFLDLGYSHLLGAYAQTINSTTNQLVDKGTQSNMGGGFTAAGFRNGQKGPIKFRMGQFSPTDMSPANLRNSIMPMPVGEPSPTLFQLNTDIQNKAERFSVLLNDSGSINANTAPTTALAMIAEQGITTSALMGRVLGSESEEFQILFRINQRFFDPELYKQILGDENADSKADFNSDMFNVVPTANAEMSSKLQRLQTSEVELLQFDRVLQSNGNPMPILRNYFEAIGGTKVEEIWPDASAMSPSDQAARDQMLSAQKEANEMQQAQLQLQERQTALLEREQDRLDSKNQADIAKIIQDIENGKADLIKTLAEASKTGEEAETESLKNAITTYTAIQQSLQNALNTTGTLNANNNVRNINPLPQPTGSVLLS